jgi:hypothetical protein
MTVTTGWCCIGRRTRTATRWPARDYRRAANRTARRRLPVISWAHGTVGVADQCAFSRDQPSSQAHPMNAYVHTLLNAFLREGWAVVITDYEGRYRTGQPHPGSGPS